MAISTRVKVFNKDLIFGVNGSLGPQARSQILADFAADQIAAVDKVNEETVGRQLPLDTIVDGSVTDNLSRVKPDGTIVAKWEIGSDVVQYIWDLIHNSGPVLTGEYRKQARIFADGTEVDDPLGAIGAKQVVILSIVPYARKIESGKKGYAPGAVYEGVAALASARYGNVARIKFTFQEPIGDISSDLERCAKAHSSKAPTPRKQARQLSKDRRQPAIMISF